MSNQIASKRPKPSRTAKIKLSKDLSRPSNSKPQKLLSRQTLYIEKLAKQSPAIFQQFYPSHLESVVSCSSFEDPLLEDDYLKTKGLVHKYSNRVLILLTMNCAAYCRFCTRRRSVSDLRKGNITEEDLDNMVSYLKKHPEVQEIIISGGDPLTQPLILQKALMKFDNLKQLKIIRIGTRLLVVDPERINLELINVLKQVKNQQLYLMFNFEHPDELTLKTKRALKKLQKVSAGMFSQTVFLKGVNDNVDILTQLFNGLISCGVKPYYIYHCDPVNGAEHFIVDIREEIRIMSELRLVLSGLAYPVHVIDSVNGSGKIPVPTSFWQSDIDSYTDFNGNILRLN